jgi:signal transduction histidine kinase
MQRDFNYLLIYFFYGLAFFSMGLLVAREGGQASDARLRAALRPLAAFGIIHALHEWLEMYQLAGVRFGVTVPPLFHGATQAMLAFSFVSLAAFGSYLLARTEKSREVILIIPVALEAIWVFGLYTLGGRYSGAQLLAASDAWVRYSLAIPASLLAMAGLIVQQRIFRREGMTSFGRDSLWAAVAFAWYGVVAGLIVAAGPLPPSNVINEQVFLNSFGIPVQILRAVSAGLAAFFIIRFLRAFQFETDRRINALQEARLEEARQREAMRGELYGRVVSAQESERQRIARDLHDETGQSLTAIGMGLRGLSSAIGQRDPERAVSTLKNLEGVSASALDELQRLIADLRPSHLDDLGLAAAVRWHAGQVEERTGLHIGVEVQGEEGSVATAAKTTLFRIVQEALNNIVKHAGAEHVSITLAFEPTLIRVRVRDDGCGFDPLAKKTPHNGRPSLGLVGIQERAALLGGEALISSQPGQGTLVEVTVPRSQDTEVEPINDDTPVTGG